MDCSNFSSSSVSVRLRCAAVLWRDMIWYESGDGLRDVYHMTGRPVVESNGDIDSDDEVASIRLRKFIDIGR